MRFRQSEMFDYMLCKRSWWLNYWLNPYPKGQTPASEYPGVSELGSLIHAGIHALYTGRTAEQGCSEYMRDEGPTLHADNTADWVKAEHEGAFFAKRFFEWVASEGHDAFVSDVGHEMELELTIGEHVVYMTVDRAFYDKNGQLRVRDYKSGKQAKELAPNDFQMLTYCCAVRAHTGVTPAFAGYATIRTVMKSEKPIHDIIDIPITDQMLDDHEEILADLLTEITSMVYTVETGEREIQVALRPTPTKDCSWRCDSRGACVVMSDGGYWEDVLPYPSGPSAGFNQRGSTSHDD